MAASVRGQSPLGPDDHNDVFGPAGAAQNGLDRLCAFFPGQKEEGPRFRVSSSEEVLERNDLSHLRHVRTAALHGRLAADLLPAADAFLLVLELHNGAFGYDGKDGGNAQLGSLLHDEVHLVDLGMPWQRVMRGKERGRLAEETISVATDARSSETILVTNIQRPCPSHSSSSSPGFMRRTVAMCRTSSPVTVMVEPASWSGDMKNRGARGMQINHEKKSISHELTRIVAN